MFNKGQKDQVELMSLPSVSELRSFVRALWRFYSSDQGFLPREKVEERLQICLACPHFSANAKKCRKCGCGVRGAQSIFNKLAMPTESCPDDPPRWTKEVVNEVQRSPPVDQDG